MRAASCFDAIRAYSARKRSSRVASSRQVIAVTNRHRNFLFRQWLKLTIKVQKCNAIENKIERKHNKKVMSKFMSQWIEQTQLYSKARVKRELVLQDWTF